MIKNPLQYYYGAIQQNSSHPHEKNEGIVLKILLSISFSEDLSIMDVQLIQEKGES